MKKFKLLVILLVVLQLSGALQTVVFAAESATGNVKRTYINLGANPVDKNRKIIAGEHISYLIQDTYVEIQDHDGKWTKGWLSRGVLIVTGGSEQWVGLCGNPVRSLPPGSSLPLGEKEYVTSITESVSSTAIVVIVVKEEEPPTSAEIKAAELVATPPVQPVTPVVKKKATWPWVVGGILLTSLLIGLAGGGGRSGGGGPSPLPPNGPAPFPGN